MRAHLTAMKKKGPTQIKASVFTSAHPHGRPGAIASASAGDVPLAATRCCTSNGRFLTGHSTLLPPYVLAIIKAGAALSVGGFLVSLSSGVPSGSGPRSLFQWQLLYLSHRHIVSANTVSGTRPASRRHNGTGLALKTSSRPADKVDSAGAPQTSQALRNHHLGRWKQRSDTL